jgi:multicomponent Na+:H+ antiporter subunit D
MTNMIPGLWMILVSIFLPVIPQYFRQPVMLLSVAASALSLLNGFGVFVEWEILGNTLILYQADNLTLPFALIFHLASVLVIIYGWHNKNLMENMATLAYAGAAIGAVHAGDFFSLFIWWEATALTSVFIVLAGNTPSARSSAMRYLIIQVCSGVLLLIGASLMTLQTGNYLLTKLDLSNNFSLFIFLAFGIKAAFPLLNGWLQDSYPESSPTGTVALSAFTTKLAIYALARTFPGTDTLIWIGAIMTAFPVFFAVIENDLRRVLSFSLNNQLGFMVVGIGIGTELSLNGTVAHAFVHIIYKALLFMSMGAVLHRVGTTKASELGGLYKYMPFTTVFCIIGAMSISAFPLFSGFVAKSLIMSALGGQGLILIYFILFFASAGVLEHSGIKIPYFAFFAHERKTKVKEAPFNMLLAMGIAASLCIGIGIFPNYLYSILPYAVEYHPYTIDHIISQLQLLVFAILAFLFLVKFKLYPAEIKSTVLNSDWFYRRMLPGIGKPLFQTLQIVINRLYLILSSLFEFFTGRSKKFANSSYFKVTTPSFAATVLIAILFVMLVLAVI